jgi:arabinogalactan endo-1,4-beta-galactosidase
MNAQALNNMNDLIVRYNKEIMVVEIGMPWDSATETRNFIKELVFNVRTLPSKKGLGVIYWEPLSYNGWQGYTLGALDNTGKPTIALNGFQ